MASLPYDAPEPSGSQHADRRTSFLLPASNEVRRPSKAASYGSLGKASRDMSPARPAPAECSPLNDSGYQSGSGCLHEPAPFEPDPQQAYYLMKTLVSMELAWERERLFRFTFDQAETENASIQSKFTDEVSLSDLTKDNLPLFSFLLHWLLRAPLIRDVGYEQTPNLEGQPSLLFWHAGLSPLLRALKGLGLSPQEEYGERGFVAHFTDAVFKGIEGFLTAGLNFSYSEVPASAADGLQGPPLRHPLGRSRSSSTSPRSSIESPTFSRLFFSPGSPESKASLRTRRSEDVLRRPTLDPDMERMKMGTDLLRRKSSSRHPYQSRAASPNLSTLHSADDEAEVSDAEDAEIQQALRMDRKASQEHLGPCQEQPAVPVIGTPVAADDSGSDGDPTIKLASPVTVRGSPTKLQVPPVPAVNLLPYQLPLPPSPYLIPDTAVDDADESFDPFERLVYDHKTRRSFSSQSSQEDLSDYVTPIATTTQVMMPDTPMAPAKPHSLKRRFTLSFSRKASAAKLKQKISYPSLSSAALEPKPINRLPALQASASLDQLREQRERQYYLGGERIMPLELPNDTFPRQSILDQALLPLLRMQDHLIVPKEPHPWPFATSVHLPKEVPVHALKYGGFQADVVACRENSFGGRSFIIRTRRPHRADEYVVRNISDFVKTRAALEKKFPDVTIRPVPTEADTEEGQDATERLNDQSDFQLKPPDHNRDRSSMSRLSLRFLDAAKERPPSTSRMDGEGDGRKRRRTSTMSTLRSMTPTDIGQSVDMYEPPSDRVRRSLRSWLRDLVTIRGIAHHSLVATLLLSNPISLKESDLQLIQQSQAIDEARRHDRKERAASADTRARLAHMFYSSVKEEIARQDGLAVLSEVLRTQPIAANLPIRFAKSLEWVRHSLASFLFDALVAGPPTTFAKFEKLNSVIPWFKLRQILKVASRKSILTRALSDLFLAKPFGSRSLLQRLISVLVDHETSYEDIATCRAKIGSLTICSKIEAFVQAPEDVKVNIRRHAELNDLPLVCTIARGGENPRLDPIDSERVMTAARHYERLLKKGLSKSALRNNQHVRLLLDMQLYLRLLSQQRDAQKIRQLFENPILGDSTHVVLQPFVALLLRVSAHGNLVDLLQELQNFCDHLLAITKAFRQRAQDPANAIRMINNLLQKYQQALYQFLHRVHLADPIIDEVFDWLRHLFQFLHTDHLNLIPLPAFMPSGSDDRDALEEEAQQLSEHYEQRRTRAYQDLCRFYAGDSTADDPVCSQGDGFGRTDLDYGLSMAEPPRPLTEQIFKHTDRFRKSIRSIFAQYAIV